MEGKDIALARNTLGEDWGVGRPLTRSELARALGLSPKNGNDHVLNMENEKSKVSGPIAILLRLYIAGAVPPSDIEIFVEKGRRRVDSETGVMPPPSRPRIRKIVSKT